MKAYLLNIYLSDSGLMGMAFKSVSRYNANPVFQTLISEGKTTKGVFEFKLSSSGAQLYIGGTDSSKHSGSFTYADITHEGYWQVELDSISVDGSEVIDSSSCIIDTGTTLLVGDHDAVQSVIDAIDGAQSAPEVYGPGLYQGQCSHLNSS